MDKATERRTDGGFCYISLIVVRGIWPTSFWKRRDYNFWKGKKQGFLFCVFDKLSKLRFISNFKIWNN
jgi:hypothetical protein